MKAQHTTVTPTYEDILNKIIKNNPSFVHLDLSELHLTEEQLKEIASKIQNNNFIGNISWGTVPHSSGELVQKIESRILLNNQNYKHHPNDYIHGLFSSHAYINSEENMPAIFTVEEQEKKCKEQIETWKKQLKTQLISKIISNPISSRDYDDLDKQMGREEELKIRKEQQLWLDSKIKEQDTELEKYKEQIKIWNKQLENWQVHKIFDKPEAGKYYGTAYINEKTKQLVLAHRGTDFTQLASDLLKIDCSLQTDLIGVLKGNIVPQIAEAYKATKHVVEHAKNEGYNLSFTGHSLGAWLAELSVYFCYHDFNYCKVKTVTFDSPGSAMQIESFASFSIINAKTEFDIKILNITTYLSAPNLVNSCNKHIGKVYRLSPKIDISEPIAKIGRNTNDDSPLYKGFASIFGHSLDPLILEFDFKTGVPTNYTEVLDWPVLKYMPREQPSYGNNILSMISKEIKNLFVPQQVEDAINYVNDSTLMSLITVLSEAIKGKIDQKQYIECFKYLDTNPEEGYTVKQELTNNEKFYLRYEGHYRITPVNLKEDILSPIKGSIDWCLSRLAKSNEKELADIKELKGIAKTQLITLQQQYKIKQVDGKKIISSSTITIEELKDKLLMLMKSSPIIEKILTESTDIYHHTESYNHTFTHNKIMLGDKTLDIVKNFVGREEVFKSIDQAFTQNGFQYIKINGIPGIGKSTCASEYAKIQKNKGITIRLFNSDSKEKVIEEYCTLATELGFDATQPINIIINLINAKLKNNSDNTILFIFDNVENYEDVKEFLVNLPSKVKVIITCRDNKLASNLLEAYPINLLALTEQDSKKYIQKSLPERVTDRDAQELIKETGLVPYKLSKAVAYLELNESLTIKEYIKEHANTIKTEIINQETAMLLRLVEKSPKAWEMLQYTAYLDPDFISIEIFKELLQLNSIEVGKCIRILQSLSLVEATNKTGEPGIKLHREVQEEVQEYVKISYQNVLNLVEKVNNLTIVLDKLMPTIEENQNEGWKIAELFYIQVNKILSDDKITIKKENEASLYNKLGLYYHHVLCNFNQAFSYFEKALTIRKELYKRQNHPELAESLYNIYFGYKDTGKDEKWLEDAQLSLKIRQELYQGNHPDIANSLNIVGFAYIRLGNSKESLIYFEKALKMRQELYQGNHPDIAQSLNNVGVGYEKLGDTKKGLQYKEEALKMLQELYVGNHHDIARSLNNVGVAYQTLGDTQKGLKYYEEALKMRQELYVGNHPDIARSLNNVGVGYDNLGDTKKGLKYYEEALKMRQELYVGNHPDIARSLNNVGVGYE
ncbi:MAG TPA: tetratricopeptide repeat protein, partial [Rickettsia endosymbiont of Omalisus fontisbellaquei]|nr:tetratricopeptide repeat protein [Rickettsia endosymbiont of Omalisus fontisbellaquei]